MNTIPWWKMSLRLLLWCTGYFVLLLGGWQLVLQLALDTLALKALLRAALLGAASFGPLLALLLLSGQALAGRRLWGEWRLPAVRQHAVLHSPLDATALREELEKRLRQWKWRLRRPSTLPEDTLLAYTPPSRFTFGERVELRVVALEDGSSRLFVTCGDNWTLVDFGLNGDHLQRLQRAVAELSATKS